MIYIGNGMFSDSGPNNYLQHYGRKGMKWGQHIFGDEETTPVRTRFGNSKVPKDSALKKMYDTYPNKENYSLFMQGGYKNSINKCMRDNTIGKLDKYRIGYQKLGPKEFKYPKSKEDTIAMCRLISTIDPNVLRKSPTSYGFSIGGHHFNVASPVYDRNGNVSAVTVSHPEFGHVMIKGVYGDINNTDFKSQLKPEYIPKDVNKLKY